MSSFGLVSADGLDWPALVTGCATAGEDDRMGRPRAISHLGLSDRWIEVLLETNFYEAHCGNANYSQEFFATAKQS
jgi:hypothetical protein